MSDVGGTVEERLWGAYSPLRRAYRSMRPAALARLTPAGREIKAFADVYGLTVRHGPFAGMQYPRRALGRAAFLAAKLLGSYELELHPVLEALAANPPPQVVDVGAAEGYYAVGLAMLMRGATRIEVFETDRGGRRQCREMAELNGVADMLNFHGSCDPFALERTLVVGGFILCDTEGYELELLDPAAVPKLASATILAELHPFVHAEIVDVMRDRLSPTHDVRVIRTQLRKQSDWKELGEWTERGAFLVMSEGARSPDRLSETDRCWIYLIPK